MSQHTQTTKPSLMRRLFARFNIVLPSLPAKPPSHEPSQNTLIELAVLIGLAVVFHFSIADVVIASFALLVFTLKIVFLFANKNLSSQRSAPPQIVIMLLTVISIALIIMLYGGWNGQRAGISFLVLLVSLKFLESRILRDYYVVCLILYFLAASSFLFNASITNITIILIYTLAITGIMLKLSSPSSINWRSSISSAGSIVGKALPLALILFFFFPRIHGSFGFIPSQDESQFDNELSNSLVAGDIATAAFNDELAFRVEFDGPIPSNNQLYWRSKVMPSEENFSWSVRSPSPNDIHNAKNKQNYLEELANENQLTSYTILHETSTDLFLPYLDYVVNFSRGRFLNNFSVWQQRVQTSSFSYSGSSTLQTNIIDASEVNTQSLLNTTSQPSARAQALLAQWRQQSSDPMQLVQQVLNHFTNNEFYYSLTPPSLDQQPVDEFLFVTKTGYCEHYASVFTILMRWLGVPARVVVGYQGGLANQSGQYLEIRYSDAHAWSEVLIDQQWVRIDPTAAISPERIEFGMSAFMSLWDSAGSGRFNAGASLTNYLNPIGMDRYYRLMRDNWNNIGYQWNKWVVNYDSDTQGELLENLGINGRNRYGMLVIIMFGSIGSILLFYFWRMLPRRLKRDEAQRYYLKFIARFKRVNVTKESADTPNEFAKKAIAEFPQQQHEINELTNAYVQLRYGKSSFDLNKFKQLVKQFRLKN